MKNFLIKTAAFLLFSILMILPGIFILVFEAVADEIEADEGGGR